MTNAERMEEKKRAKRKRRIKSTTASSSMPTGLVCTAADLAEHPGAVEMGVLLVLFILLFYFYGCYQTFMALPEAPRTPVFYHHLGQNLNVAHPSEWDAAPQDGANDSSPQRDLQQQQGKDTTHDLLRKKPVNTATEPQRQQAAAVAPKIPKAKWPVSIKDEVDDFEIITHPGDNVSKLRVPPFWSPPVHGNTMMSRDTALQIGSCIEPDPATGSYNRGDDCPVDKRTIYVGIASYRDFECRSTAESIFLRAKHPERIRIGVVDQIVDGEDAVCDAPIEPCETHPEQGLCKYRNQIDVIQMEARLSIGPVFARHVGYRMYRGEYYATQSDAHVTYTQDWDADIISQLEATQNEMAVLTTYLTDIQGSIDANGNSLRHTRPIMCNTYYEGGPQGLHLRHGSQPEREPTIHGVPQLQPWWAAGYSFSRGHFVVNVPYDWLQPMIFQGEEMSIGIRGFTIGYDYYAPERSVCFHHYAVGKNAKVRNKVHHFWENTNQYAGTGKKAMARLLGLVHMNPEVDPSTWNHTEEAIYGIGGVRSPELFYDTFGIDVKKKTVQGHLCSFVHDPPKMHRDFTKLLRPNGMGIDYSQVHYHFKDPRPGQP